MRWVIIGDPWYKVAKRKTAMVALTLPCSLVSIGAVLAAGLLWAVTGSAAAQAPELGLPLECTIGETCFIQQYVDIDPGSGVQDYACGGVTYDGHKGTDFRVRTLRDATQGVPVVAAAPGTVKALRDGVRDRLVRNDHDRLAVNGRECGNGVVIAHGDGWETQYCHLKQSSIVVRKGEDISRGQIIGSVGWSGQAEFPHVHLEVRHNGKVVDPFTGRVPSGKCGAQAARSLWAADTRARLAYSPGRILAFDFAAGAVDIENLVAGTQPRFAPSRNAPAIVVYVWVINLAKGDSLRLVFNGPGGPIARRVLPPLDRNKAQYMIFTGKKRPGAGWPAGPYSARVQVIRSGKPVHSMANSFEID